MAGAASGPSPGPARGPASSPSPGPARGPASGPAPGPARGPASGPAPGPASGPAPGPARYWSVAPANADDCIANNNVGNFDLASVLKVQKDYLFDVTNRDGQVDNAPEIVEYVSNVQNKLKDLSDKFDSANSSSQAVLSHQQQMLDIVNAEKTRLNEKKVLIDNAGQQQEHVMVLNNTYRKQYAEYTKIVIVVVIGISVFILLRLFADFLQIPDFISILLHIANIVVCAIAVTVLYAAVQMRSKIDFEKLELPPPNTGPAAYGPSTAGSSLENKSLFELLGICYGEKCCDQSNGVVWDTAKERCVAKPVAKPVSPPPAVPVAPTAPPVSMIDQANSGFLSTATDARAASEQVAFNLLGLGVSPASPPSTYSPAPS